jgi:hypothetical protein
MLTNNFQYHPSFAILFWANEESRGYGTAKCAAIFLANKKISGFGKAGHAGICFAKQRVLCHG